MKPSFQITETRILIKQAANNTRQRMNGGQVDSRMDGHSITVSKTDLKTSFMLWLPQTHIAAKKQ